MGAGANSTLLAAPVTPAAAGDSAAWTAPTGTWAPDPTGKMNVPQPSL